MHPSSTSIHKTSSGPSGGASRRPRSKRKDYRGGTGTQARLPERISSEEDERQPTPPVNGALRKAHPEPHDDMLDLQGDETDEDLDNELPAHNPRVNEMRADCVRMTIDGLLVSYLCNWYHIPIDSVRFPSLGLFVMCRSLFFVTSLIACDLSRSWQYTHSYARAPATADPP